MATNSTKPSPPCRGALDAVGGAFGVGCTSPSLYILSTGYVPVVESELEKGVIISQKKISVEEARELIKNTAFTSAIGHEATAKILSQLLDIEIPYNRVAVFLRPGDSAICFILKQRPPEGKILSQEELEQIGYYLVLTSVQSAEVS